ncbi:MAG: hypothetical protein KDA61_07560, partial [Planctomycetales bacterium]|nr:hypothetical protein [Planctomycetales bacterium]
MATDTDDLAFVTLALQLGLVSQPELLRAVRSRRPGSSERLLDILLSQGVMEAATHAAATTLLRHCHACDRVSLLDTLKLSPGGFEVVEALETAPSRSGEGGPGGLEPSTAPAGQFATLPPRPQGGDAVLVERGGDRFRMVGLHAQGGLGEVWAAEDSELKRRVALKQMRSRHADDPASRARFVLEAEITGRLEHPGIVPVYALGRRSDGRPFYAMRFICGESLQQAIDRY